MIRSRVSLSSTAARTAPRVTRRSPSWVQLRRRHTQLAVAFTENERDGLRGASEMTAPLQAEVIEPPVPSLRVRKLRTALGRHAWAIAVLAPLALVAIIFAYPIYEIFKKSFTEFLLPSDH